MGNHVKSSQLFFTFIYFGACWVLVSLLRLFFFFFLVAASRGLLLVAVLMLLAVVAFLVAEHRL